MGASEYYIFLGNFGSGKSELSLNMALKSAQKGRDTMMLDLDVVNPYFRSSERHEELEAAGVRFVGPTYALHRIEIMSLPAEIYGAFAHKDGTVVFDAGGDPVGATALGQYKPYFNEIPKELLHVLFVINPMRPLARTAQKCLALMRGIEASCRLSVTGLVNNANMLADTTKEELLCGYEVVKELSEKTGVPVWGTAGLKAPLEAFLSTAGLDMRYVGDPFAIDINMHRDWDSYLKKGI